ncbi:hypothetical protein N7465_002502 [Penicillium sp. CMV-2018d]|nr:hypothetical protein N7465_002502 [Penicillium sp. CMV-2018d]
MNSGSILPANPVDGTKGQLVYDTVVNSAGCSGACYTLECLRCLDYTKLLNAANSVPGILGYNLTTSDPGQIRLDEGTVLSPFQNNLTTPDHIVDYLQNLVFSDASRQHIADLVATYQDIKADGSPFRTISLCNWYPQYKRQAAILGDLSFTLTRRAFLNYDQKAKPNVPSWSYLSSYDHGLPFLGTSTDLMLSRCSTGSC